MGTSDTVESEYSLSSSISMRGEAQEELYILDLVISRSSNSLVASSLSDGKIQLFKLEGLQKTDSIKKHGEGLTGIRFSHENPQILWSSYSDGKICCWDLRKEVNKPIQELKDTSDNEVKPISCFDVDLSDTFVCGGTELIIEDSFLLFWDVRTSQLLGGYWDSHTDDITEVRYHPFKRDVLASGSTDGLVNIFDVKEATEEDALQLTLNCNSSVNTLAWLSQNDHEDQLSCITHDENMYLWENDDVIPKFTVKREQLKHSFQNTENVDYLVKTFPDNQPNSVQLLTGTASGQCLLWAVSKENNMFSILNGGHQGIIRAAQLIEESQTILTGAEDGRICVWIKETSSENFKALSGIKEKLSKYRIQPY
ncbi:WD repeat-containing protein 89 isoform X2 [Tachypleus tridentatus]|uniref:WD repeat-containing protein 89 isoform X2 n=1 Tax=Tachypleus tridentatus TaxID=6853 RepID=UPI003FD12797